MTWNILSSETLKTNAAHRAMILDRLRVILSVTQDLASLPSPDSEELLDGWIRRQAMIVLGHRGQQCIALCVCVWEMPSHDPQKVTLQIQYLGVIPEHRRTGAASAMLRCLPRLVPVTNEPDTLRCLQLTAFADTSNIAAAHLYQTCGFQVDSEYDLWFREMN
jgi:ribosomal protein S18 acetylase RimI-like enzyme